MMRSITINKPGKRSFGVKCLAVLVIIGVWQWISLSLPDILFASPLETLRALARMARSGELARQLLTSGGRMLAGFFCGTAAGIAAGLLAGIFSIVYEAMRPFLSLLMGIPPIILVVLAMVWFGTGATVPVFVVSLLVFPSIYLNTADGWRGIDRQLLQMAEVYQIGPMKNCVTSSFLDWPCRFLRPFRWPQGPPSGQRSWQSCSAPTTGSATRSLLRE